MKTWFFLSCFSLSRSPYFISWSRLLPTCFKLDICTRKTYRLNICRSKTLGWKPHCDKRKVLHRVSEIRARVKLQTRHLWLWLPIVDCEKGNMLQKTTMNITICPKMTEANFSTNLWCERLKCMLQPLSGGGQEVWTRGSSQGRAKLRVFPHTYSFPNPGKYTELSHSWIRKSKPWLISSFITLDAPSCYRLCMASMSVLASLLMRRMFLMIWSFVSSSSMPCVYGS